MRNRPALTSDEVKKMMAACEAEAARNGWAVTIAIVDDAGYPLNLLRLEGAGPMSSHVALGKARTAALTRRPSQFWEERVKERPGFLRFPEILPVTGGVPVMVGIDCVGAVGVSGVQSHQDEQIALAGAQAVQVST
jgi:glc operon protein GlcG